MRTFLVGVMAGALLASTAAIGARTWANGDSINLKSTMFRSGYAAGVSDTIRAVADAAASKGDLSRAHDCLDRRGVSLDALLRFADGHWEPASDASSAAETLLTSAIRCD